MSAQILLFPVPNKRRAQLQAAYEAAALADFEKESLAQFCAGQQVKPVKSWLDI